VSLSTTLNP